MRNRLLIMLAILAVQLLAFASLGRLFWRNWEQTGNWLDLSLCYLTLTGCPFSTLVDTPYWDHLLILNAIAFGFWLLYILALYGFLLGKGPTRRVLGGLFAGFLPMLWFFGTTAFFFLQ